MVPYPPGTGKSCPGLGGGGKSAGITEFLRGSGRAGLPMFIIDGCKLSGMDTGLKWLVGARNRGWVGRRTGTA